MSLLDNSVSLDNGAVKKSTANPFRAPDVEPPMRRCGSMICHLITLAASLRPWRSILLAPRLLSATLALAAAGCATAPAVTAPGLPLKRVVIYRNGVGYFERAGHVESDRVEFRVRRNEVGDFLASLTVLERGGSSVRAAAFPMPPDSGPDAGTKLQTVVMSLGGGNHDLSVGYIAEAPIWRPSYRLVIDKDGASLQTWGIVQNLSGEDWTNVSLSLIAEAPLAFDASLARAVVPPRPQITDDGEVIAVVPRSETSLAQEPAAPPPPPPAPAPAEMASDDAESERAVGGAPRKEMKKGRGPGAASLPPWPRRRPDP